jgi:hypothetical protein
MGTKVSYPAEVILKAVNYDEQANEKTQQPHIAGNLLKRNLIAQRQFQKLVRFYLTNQFEKGVIMPMV